MADDGLTAGAVARRLGVAVTTLRTWHQRYGLGPSQHVPGHHRRYSATDLDRLEVMRRLTNRGVPPAEAAAWALRLDATAARPRTTNAAVTGSAPDAPPPPPGVSAPATGGLEIEDGGAPGSRLGGSDSPADAEGLMDAWLDMEAQLSGARDGGGIPGARDGGGNAIPVGRAGPGARGLARAAMRLDATAMREIIAGSVADRGVVATWDEVVVPVLVGIGHRHAATMRLIEVEHLTSRCVTEAFSLLVRARNAPDPHILLACADEEQHSLALEALAAALAEAGVATRLLGARVPSEALADAVERTGPTAVVVWSQLPRTADPAQLEHVLAGRHRPLLVAAAGPGWDSDTLPPDVPLLTSLADAVRTLLAATAPG